MRRASECLDSPGNDLAVTGKRKLIAACVAAVVLAVTALAILQACRGYMAAKEVSEMAKQPLYIGLERTLIDTELPVLPELTPSNRKDIDPVVEHGDRAVPHLGRVLAESGEKDARALSILALAAIQTTSAAKEAARGLDDAFWLVRKLAAETVVANGGSELKPRLLRMMTEDRSGTVRMSIARLLSEDEELRPDLLPLMVEAKDGMVRMELAEGLSKGARPSEISFFVRALEDDVGNVVWSALGALGSMANAEAEKAVGSFVERERVRCKGQKAPLLSKAETVLAEIRRRRSSSVPAREREARRGSERENATIGKEE